MMTMMRERPEDPGNDRPERSAPRRAEGAHGGEHHGDVAPSALEPRALRWPPTQPLDDVDQAGADSFPASDPPPWTGLRLGAPGRPGR